MESSAPLSDWQCGWEEKNDIERIVVSHNPNTGNICGFIYMPFSVFSNRQRPNAVTWLSWPDFGGLHWLLGWNRYLPPLRLRQVQEWLHATHISASLPIYDPFFCITRCLSCYRKKVLDFYQRACLSGYCSAFAYKPMQVSLSSQLNGKCVELAPGPCLFTGVELPSTTPIKHTSCRNSWSSDGMTYSYNSKKSVLIGKFEGNLPLISSMSTEGIGEGLEREDCVQALSGQIFMGMVSSQFQARLDTVRLIDALVTACIRFVYFSMEDELRSKVNS